MTRITPEIILEAYKKAGLKAIRGAFLRDENGRAIDAWESFRTPTCGCAAGVLYITRHGYPQCEDDVWTWFRQTYGYDYSEGFWRGFDNNPINDEEPNYLEGWEDGQAAFKAVSEAGLLLERQP